MAKTGLPEGMRGVIGWALGVGILAFILLILLIIFGNLSGNVGFSQDSTAFTNETIVFTDAGSTPATAQNRVNGALSGVVVRNATGGEVVPSTNYTISGVLVIADGSSAYNGTNVNVSGTVSYDSQGLINSNSVIDNYSISATNTAGQFPVVGTIVGIALLLLVLIGILVFAIVKMMHVAGATGMSTRGGSSNFGASRSSYG